MYFCNIAHALSSPVQESSFVHFSPPRRRFTWNMFCTKKNTNPKQVLSKITIQALIDLNQMLYLNHIRWLIFSQKCVLFCSWYYLLYSFRKGTISSQFPKLLPCDIKIFTLLSSHYLENVRRIANALQVTLWTLIVMIWLFLFFLGIVNCVTK